MEWSRVGMKGALLAGCSVIALSAGEANALVLVNCTGTGLVAGTSCTLEELIRNTGSIQVDDKLFDGWGFPQPFSTGTGNGEAGLASNVKITG
ncbi:MAG: hypothetical protein WD673_03340 [Alphaproteobacteria bacterium]